jgi:hypothetical protein
MPSLLHLCDASSSVSYHLHLEEVSCISKISKACVLDINKVAPRNYEHHYIVWGDQNLNHVRMHPRSNPGLPRDTSRLFTRAPWQVPYRDSRCFPFTNCMFIPPTGARPKLTASMAYLPKTYSFLWRRTSELCLSDNRSNDCQKQTKKYFHGLDSETSQSIQLHSHQCVSSTCLAKNLQPSAQLAFSQRSRSILQCLQFQWELLA